MATDPHRVGRFAIRATVGDLDAAKALRPRIEALTWRTIPRVIERVCDAIDPGQHLHVARLDLDLGRVSAEHMEEETLSALETALTDALGEALHGARFAPSEAARLLSSPMARLERLEAYLASGVIAHAAGGEFVPHGALMAGITEDPQAFVAMLRRHGRNQRLLERLVLQLGAAGLPIVIGLLAPADAATIVALVADIVIAHRLESVAAAVPLATPALERLLWITTIEFLLRDAGSQFNRRRFLDALLRREAAHAGIDHMELLRLLHHGVTAARDRSSFRSSLPVVLAALLAEFNLASDGANDVAPPPVSNAATAFATARAGDFSALEAWVRQHADDRAAIEAIVARLDAPLFAGLIHALEPANVDAIVAIVEDVTLLNRAEPLLVEDGLERMLRWMTLRYLLYDAGTGFNRRRFVAHLIAREAERAGIGYPDLLRLMHAATQRSRTRIGFRTSLPAALTELLAETATPETAPAPAEPDPAHLALIAARKGDLAPLVALLRRIAPRAKTFAALVDRLEPPLYSAVLTQLKPTSAATVQREIDTLAALHHAIPLATLSGLGFSRLLRRVALAGLLGDTNARFNRRTWLRRLIDNLAGEIGVDGNALRATIAQALRKSGATQSVLAAELAGSDPGAPPDDDAASLVTSLDSGKTSTIALLRELAKSPVRLQRAAAALREDQRHQLLAALVPADIATVAGELRIVARLHRAEALGSWGADAFDQLLWALAIEHFATRRAARLDRDALIRHVLAGIARHDGERASVVNARIERAVERIGMTDAHRRAIAERPPDPQVADARQAVEVFLRTGVSTTGGPALVDAAQRQPLWLAAIIKRLARETSTTVPVLITRLLEWLLPEEIFACLMPGEGAQWRQWIDDDALTLRSALATLLEKGVLPAGHKAPSGARYDHLALLTHWLDHGSSPWWASDGVSLSAMMDQATLAELAALFPGGEDRTLDRLGRAAALLEPARYGALIARIAPWTMERGGSVQALFAEPGGGDIVLRTTAAALAEMPFDIDALRQSPPARSPAAAVTPTDDIARLFAWLDGAPASPDEVTALARLFATLVDAGSEQVREHIAARRSDRAARERWSRLLPAEGLARLVDLLAPRGFIPRDAILLLATAWRQVAPFSAHRPSEAELWATMLAFAATPNPPPTADIVNALVAALAGADEAAATALRTRAIHLARDGAHPVVAAILRRAGTPRKENPPFASPARPKGTDAKQPEPSPNTEEPDHAIYIANAGLVLLNPYIPALFERLGLLTTLENGKPRIEGMEAMSRAVHLLQYCADARLDAPEPMLVLNKLLCGLPTAQPVAPAIEPAPADLEICDSLLDAMIANWPIIRNTSQDGLRETFLQRDGRLLHADGKWTLHVQRKGLDVLVDQIPWSITMIYHRWMPEPIHVTW